MRIIPFTTQRGRRAYRGMPPVLAGDRVYAIQDERTKLYFVWSYVHRDQAEKIAGLVTVGDQTDRDFNWRRDIQQTVPSSRKKNHD